MDVIVIECEQGSDEWKAARVACITGSMFPIIRAKVGLPDAKQQTYIDAIRAGRSQAAAMALADYKAPPKAEVVQCAIDGEKVGEWSDKAKNYAFRLAVERISGEAVVDDPFETFAMRRGKELEEDCRKCHEQDLLRIGEPDYVIDLAGFVKTKDGKFGFSADGLIGEVGISEYKAFYASDSVRPILIDNNWGDIMAQTQGGLWLTGRKWVDICLYFPALRSIGKHFKRERFFRNEAYIESLEQDLVDFERLVTELETQIRTAA
jgi:hypothetical protein